MSGERTPPWRAWRKGILTRRAVFDDTPPPSRVQADLQCDACGSPPGRPGRVWRCRRHQGWGWSPSRKGVGASRRLLIRGQKAPSSRGCSRDRAIRHPRGEACQPVRRLNLRSGPVTWLGAFLFGTCPGLIWTRLLVPPPSRGPKKIPEGTPLTPDLGPLFPLGETLDLFL